MIFRITFAFFLFQNVLIHAQSLNDYVSNNIHQIISINPEDTDFTDLNHLGIAIENARVVMLGEQDHGDAPTFMAKSRIVKYLHQEKGYNVLAFESDFYGINRSFDAYKAGKLDMSEVIKNVFPIWTFCEQSQGVFEYLKSADQSGEALILSGIDCQDHLNYSRNHLVYEIDSLIQLISFSFEEDYPRSLFLENLNLLIGVNFEKFKKLPKAKHRFFIDVLDKLEIQFKLKSLDPFLIQTIRSIKSEAYNVLQANHNKLDSDNIRDQQMAENLLWLLNHKYPNQKIIVWLHSGHASKDMNEVVKTNLELYSVGKLLNKSIGDELYVLAFTSYNGSTGRLTKNSKQSTYNIPFPSEISIEHLIDKSNFEYALLDFRNSSIVDKPFKMKGVSHYELECKWSKVFDGVFYIKKMFPCNKIE